MTSPSETTEVLAARYGSRYRWYATVTVMLGVISAMLTTTSVNVAIPDIMGALRAWHPDGRYTEAAYFTSEEAARAAEAQEPPPEVKRLFDEQMALAGDIEWFDLREPWLLA